MRFKKIVSIEKSLLAGELDFKQIQQSVKGEYENFNHFFVNLISMIKFAQYKKPDEVTVIITYDIEDNKIRRYISKYLIRKGCIRIQRSVFMVKINRKLYNEIKQTIKEVQEFYENNDSVIFVPVSEDMFSQMMVIGKEIELEISSQNANTLFI
jgi:CRISPR-associated endonuclease Cas2